MTTIAMDAPARDPLSQVFAALADPTRRAILARLKRGPATVGELGETVLDDPARPSPSTCGCSRRPGLVSRSRIAQSRPAALEAAPLEQVAEWAEEFRQFWDQRFDRLDDYLTTMTDDETRDAPLPGHLRRRDPRRHLHPRPPRVRGASRRVWRAMTEPEHMKRWLGNPEFPLTTCEMDVRVGGGYRWVFGSGERSMGVSGTLRGGRPSPRLLVSTEQFDDFPGPSTNTLGFAALGEDRTAMTLSVVYPDPEIRDGWVASGMTEGLGVGYDRLDAVLADVTDSPLSTATVSTRYEPRRDPQAFARLRGREGARAPAVRAGRRHRALAGVGGSVRRTPTSNAYCVHASGRGSRPACTSTTPARSRGTSEPGRRSSLCGRPPSTVDPPCCAYDLREPAESRISVVVDHARRVDARPVRRSTIVRGLGAGQLGATPSALRDRRAPGGIPRRDARTTRWPSWRMRVSRVGPPPHACWQPCTRSGGSSIADC